MKSYNNANFVPISWLFPLDLRLFNMTLKFPSINNNPFFWSLLFWSCVIISLCDWLYLLSKTNSQCMKAHSQGPRCPPWSLKASKDEWRCIVLNGNIRGNLPWKLLGNRQIWSKGYIWMRRRAPDLSLTACSPGNRPGRSGTHTCSNHPALGNNSLQTPAPDSFPPPQWGNSWFFFQKGSLRVHRCWAEVLMVSESLKAGAKKHGVHPIQKQELGQVPLATEAWAFSWEARKNRICALDPPSNCETSLLPCKHSCIVGQICKLNTEVNEK